MGRSWLLVCLAGCYDPHAVGGTCTSTSECPPGLDCVGGICGGTTTVDAAVDAPRILLVPSNGVERTLAAKATGALDIAGGDATFNTDTGRITGAFTRANVVGVDHGIYFERRQDWGVFVATSLDVAASGSITLTGGRAAIILVATTATIDGTIDGSAAQAEAGPGGDNGTTAAAVGTGACNHGGTGTSGLSVASTGDGGGGGGGGGTTGAAGGDAGAYTGGGGGATCVMDDLQPLVGGGGGGGGGAGLTTGASGGGGGGALQLTALGSIALDGTNTMAGAGGDGGPGDASNGSGGGGGGAGGGILL